MKFKEIKSRFTAAAPSFHGGRFLRLALALSLAASLAFASAGHGKSHGRETQPAAAGSIGTVDFQVACDEAVQAEFDRGLALMHHMMYQRAHGTFEEIIEKDPDCGMAYWGVATTMFQPLWPTRPGEEELRRGLNLVEKAASLVEDERESNLVSATKVFFEEPGKSDYWTRIRRWSEGMKSAYLANRDDPDTAALYALSRITLAGRAEDREPLHDEAEAVLRGIYEKIPTHPGAIHYTIHSTDVDGRAGNAPDMVEAYGKIAPEVPHALHMASHIYVRLGDWPKVIDLNRRSADAALKESDDETISHHYIHALDYLLYAYLQQGQDQKATKVLEEAMKVRKHQPSFISAYHAAAMPARHAVERRRWLEATVLQPRTPEYLPWDEARWPEGVTWFALGLGAVHTDNLKMAREAEKRLVELREGTIKAGEENLASYIEIDRLILSGLIKWAEDDGDQARELISAAAKLEKKVEKNPTTPGSLLPPSEALGNLLMDLNRPAAALEAYRESDKIWPKRYHTTLGAARAAAAAGDPDTARTYYQRLLEFTKDSRRAGVIEAREFPAVKLGIEPR